MPWSTVSNWGVSRKHLISDGQATLGEQVPQAIQGRLVVIGQPVGGRFVYVGTKGLVGEEFLSTGTASIARDRKSVV